MRGLGDLVVVLQSLLPPWAIVVVGVVLAVVLFPGWRYSMRVKQLKGRVRRLLRADTYTRAELVESCFAIAGDNPDLLESLANEAIKMGHPDVRDRAVAQLAAQGKHALVQTLKKKYQPVQKVWRNPLEVLVVAQRLAEDNMDVMAMRRVDEGLAQFPMDKELLALREQLLERASSPS